MTPSNVRVSGSKMGISSLFLLGTQTRCASGLRTADGNCCLKLCLRLVILPAFLWFHTNSALKKACPLATTQRRSACCFLRTACRGDGAAQREAGGDEDTAEVRSSKVAPVSIATITVQQLMAQAQHVIHLPRSSLRASNLWRAGLTKILRRFHVAARVRMLFVQIRHAVSAGSPCHGHVESLTTLLEPLAS